MPAAIGDHALLADGRTAALVDLEGNIAWLCWPRVDSMPCLLSLLDAQRGGRFSMRPRAGDAQIIDRAYVNGSLVLRTVWDVHGSHLVVDEALAWRGAQRLVRTARCDDGAVDITIRFAPAFDAGRLDARIELAGHTVRASARGIRLALLSSSTWMAAGSGEVQSHTTVVPGSPATLALCQPEDLAAPPAESVIADSLASWAALRPDLAALRLSPLAERTLGKTVACELLAVSASVLLGLRQRTGGIVAAPTTSLPQWPGSSRTWDYRYCWLRDSSLAANALTRLGMPQPAQELGAFIGDVAMADGPRALVRVDGGPAPEERVLDHLRGFGGAAPVRVGNAAADQPQLDVCGEVIELASALASSDALPDSLRRAVPGLADWAVRHWREPDHGIWEIRGPRHHYTHSRLLAWYGLREAVALAGRGVVAGDSPAWEGCARSIQDAILRSADATGALQLHAYGCGADAALALVPLLGLLPPEDPRVGATLDMITGRLARNGLIDRYQGRPDELDDACGPFLFPTHWTAMALEACGRDGAALFAAAAAARGSTGLFAEVASPEDGSPLGNYPQVQSHASFILAAVDPS
ncbi:MAG: glycoside hydrolase family 15 protein [Candidatus Dormibacteria bacterium]